MIFPRNSCLIIGRRLGVNSVASSLPRQFAFSSQTRFLSSVGLHRFRPLNVRVPSQSLLLLPGSTRSFWWSSSKPTPAPQNNEAAKTAENATDAFVVAEPPPAEATTIVDTAQDAASAAATSPVLDVPIDSTASAAADAIVNATSSIPPPPLNYGDLAALGLGGGSPIGLCQAAIESLQVFTGMPWFWTIVSATVLARLVLFPFTVMGLRNSAKLAPYQEQMSSIREEMNAARGSGDPLSMQKAVVKQRLLYQKSGVSIGGMFVPTLVQIPVTLGMFFAVKRMCDLPVEQLKYSGFDLIPDLTVADPTWTLPIITVAVINAQLSLSVKDMAAANPNAGHIINAFRGLSMLSLFFMAKFPAGTLIYLLTGVAFMSLQSLVMRLPAVRRFFGVPVLPTNLQAKPYSMLESIKYARDTWRKSREEAIQQSLRPRK